ncbi:MAG: phosphotransferase [Dehalococcoidia bacterium]
MIRRGERTTELDARAALGCYALSDPAVAGLTAGGFINDSWIVADAGERYVLRAYRRAPEASRIAFQLAFQEHLLTSGFPTAPIIKSRSGEASASSSGLYWTLFGLVAGQGFDFSSLDQAREAGARLAEFEAVAAGYAGPVVAPPMEQVAPRNWLAPVSSHVWRTSMLDEEQEGRLRELFAGEGFEEELEFFSQWHRAAAAVWTSERLTALPQAWLHGDYHGLNMVFQGDEMVGLFDFDFVTRGPRVFDVSRGLFNFGRERRGSTTLREPFCRAFLDGYESLAPLSEEERRALPFMAVLNWVPDASFYAARMREADAPDIGDRLRQAVRVMRAIQSEMRRLAPRFGWAEAR